MFYANELSSFTEFFLLNFVRLANLLDYPMHSINKY
jgi:hypothetical protein